MSGREAAASELVAILDSPFLRALTEPARLEVLRVLLLHGAADVGAIAEQLPQDRSVVSRHLQVLEAASIVRSRREGRRRIYEIDGGSFIGKLDHIAATARSLAPLCCPTDGSD